MIQLIKKVLWLNITLYSKIRNDFPNEEDNILRIEIVYLCWLSMLLESLLEALVGGFLLVSPCFTKKTKVISRYINEKQIWEVLHKISSIYGDEHTGQHDGGKISIGWGPDLQQLAVVFLAFVYTLAGENQIKIYFFQFFLPSS